MGDSRATLRERGTADGGDRPRVVIVGGGFGGVYVARHLERLRARDEFEILLVNKENHFVFQPMLPEVISGTIGLVDVVSPLRRLLPQTNLHVREVEAIDLQNQTITTSTGFHPHPHVVHWDHLVLGLGTVTDFRGMRGLPEHAFPFKNLSDALSLRNHVIRTLEEAAIEVHDPDLRHKLLTFVVAGGGFSGVEVVAELNDFVRHVAKNYAGIDPHEIRVVLLHAGERILPEMDERVATFAQRILSGSGVEIRLNTRLAAATGDEALLAGGERIGCKTLISTVPASPHPLVESLSLPKTKSGRIQVDPTLAAAGSARVWALGDCAAVPAPDGGLAPPTAQHAIRQAEVIAWNIAAALRGSASKTYAFRGLGRMGSLGRRSAVADVFGVKIRGFLAWVLWRAIYLFKMPGWGRRLKVAVSWALDLLLPPELVQLPLGGSLGVVREHFEPGQEVFRQGDVGDRVYIVLSGRAEVLRELGGFQQTLATLGRGQYFGEMALLRSSARNATVRCVEAMDVLSLPKREFTLLSENLPQLRQEFQRTSDERGARSGEPDAAQAETRSTAG